MTREEFIKKYNLVVEKKSTDTGVIRSLFRRNEEFVEKGDFLYTFKDNAGKYWNGSAPIAGQISYKIFEEEKFSPGQILAVVANKKLIDFFDMKSSEYEKLVLEHRNKGDLIDFWLKEEDKNPLVHKIIDSFATEDEKDIYNSNFEKHLPILCEELKDKNDIESWLSDLRFSDQERYFKFLRNSQVCNSLKENFSKKITEHRATGDLMDYLWELSEKGVNLRVSSYNSSDIEGATQKYPFESLILNPLLLSSEKKELGELRSVIEKFGESFEDYALTSTWLDGFKYIFKLSQAPKDSIEYKRYQKIRNKITKTETLEKLDKSITKTILISRLKKIGIIAGAALILILVGAFTINRAVTKNARMAKKEAQRIERVKVKKTKDIKKAQEYDLWQLEKLSAKKLSKQELLVQTAEPTMYVIAPMTYDTKKFSQDNSHDSAMFGFKTVDNSVERLGILETCITDFENKVDELTGVSFLDRSKISQIEKEHKFQLGDWSNNKKTAEVGKALNANILLFLDKFTYVDAGSGQYRFEAKFVDVNTMQSSSFVVAYKNPKKKIVTPEVISQISFRDFTPISTKNDSFDDELYLKTQNVIRTVQKKDMKIVSPLGAVTKVQTSEFDVNTPKTEFANASSIKFDGFGELELDSGSEKKSYSYTFDANEIFIERNGYNFYTDGKIGVLTVSTDGDYEKFTVFTNNNREYYLRLGSVELEKAFVNYYLQMVKQ